MAKSRRKVENWEDDASRLLAYQVIDEFMMPQRVKNYKTGKMETKVCPLGRGVRWIIKYALSCEVYGIVEVHASNQYLARKYNEDMAGETVKGTASVRDIQNWISMAKRTGLFTTANYGKRRTLEINMVFLKEKMIETRLRDLALEKIRETQRLALKRELAQITENCDSAMEEADEQEQKIVKGNSKGFQMYSKCDLDESKSEITSVISGPNSNGGGNGNRNGLITDGKPSKKSRKRKKFVPPSKQEVKAYCEEKGYNVDPDFFVEYYEANDWHDKNGSPVKSWKQRVVTWAKHNQASDNMSAHSMRVVETSDVPEVEMSEVDSSKKERDLSIQETYESPLVEEAYKLWEDILGQPCKRTKQNSQAAWEMMRAKAKGREWLRGMLLIVRESKKDRRADFRVKNIANLVDIQRNWEYALDWYRQKASEQSESNVMEL